MNRMDAILTCNALSRECEKHRDCKDCPVRLENNEEYDCLITYINENDWDRKFFTKLANDEIRKACAEEKCKNEQESFASGDKLSPVESRLSDKIKSWEKAADKHNDNPTPSVPLENVGSIIIRGSSNSTELAAALKDPSNMTLTVTESDKEHDNVNCPKHYCKGGVESIDFVRAAVSNLSGFEAVCVANIIKYAWRYKEKNGLEDVMKARKYLEWLQEEVGKNANKA